MFVCKRSKRFEIMRYVPSIVIKYGYPRSRTAETCKKLVRVFNSNIHISPRVTVVIEMTLFINYVLSIQSELDMLSIQSELDIINSLVTSVYE